MDLRLDKLYHGRLRNYNCTPYNNFCNSKKNLYELHPTDEKVFHDFINDNKHFYSENFNYIFR